MGRKNIFNLITGNAINVKIEYNRFKELIEEEIFYKKNHDSFTLFEYLDINFFRSWPYRHRAIDLDDYLTSIDIRDDNGDLKVFSLENLLLYIEIFLNLIYFSKLTDVIEKDYESTIDSDLFNTIFNNINDLLNSLNYKYTVINKSRVIIVEKDPIATNVAENNPEIADEIIEYRKYSLKGNINEKVRILKLLSNNLEGKLKSLKETSYSQLASDIGYLINNYDIRHNNKEGTYKKAYMKDITEEELEEIYDMTYELILSVYTTNNYLNYNKIIDELKKKYPDNNKK